MLLHEIIDASKMSPPDPDFDEEKFAAGKEELGSGQTARAFRSNVPGAVEKLMYLKGMDDPALQFIREIQKHSDNPYFPRVYDINIQRTGKADGGVPVLRVQVQMEKLIPLKDPKIIRAVSDKLQHIGVLPQGEELDERTFLKAFFRDRMDDIINTSADPKLAEALQVLKPLFKEFGLDLHHKNLMVRLTGVGPQIVLADPIVPTYGHYDQ